MQPGLTGTSAGLEQGGSSAVGTAAMVAEGAGARGCGCGGSGGQGTAAGASAGVHDWWLGRGEEEEKMK